LAFQNRAAERIQGLDMTLAEKARHSDAPVTAPGDITENAASRQVTVTEVPLVPGSGVDGEDGFFIAFIGGTVPPLGTTLTFGAILDNGPSIDANTLVPCFVAGTLIETAKGQRPVESLKVGDKVMTMDNGLQPIRWIGSQTVRGTGALAPIVFEPHSVEGLTKRLLVSPQHRMFIAGSHTELLFGESEVFVAAKHLVNGDDIYQEDQAEVTYLHIMFDTHEIVFAEGAATESFFCGKVGLGAISDDAREEVFAIFPDLSADLESYGQTARYCLRPHEARLLTNAVAEPLIRQAA